MSVQDRSRSTLRVAAWLAGAWLVVSGLARAEDWAQWRGPLGNGVSGEHSLPVAWSPSDALWRVELPGPAGATPIVFGDRIFVSSQDGDSLVLLCFDRAGKQQWRAVVGQGNKDVRGDEGNSCSPSPCTDGERVWCLMGNGSLGCYEAATGKEHWRLDLGERYGKLDIAFGLTSTPVLHKGRLYLQLIHGDGNPATREAKVVALDAASGDEIWRQERPSDASAECEHSYASPVLFVSEGREYLLSHGADYVVAHNLEDGAELWRCGDLNPTRNYNRTLRFVASPVATPELIVVPSAKNGPVLAILPDAAGDLTGGRAHRPWMLEHNTPDVPSPLIHGGLVYLCRENGTLMVLDAKNGEEIYNERVHSQRHRASPVYADGKLYLSARDGVVSVIRAGREFELLAQNNLGEPLSASPAISDGVLYLRTFNALYAFRAK